MTQTKEFKEHWLDLLNCARHKDGNCMYQISTFGNVRKRTANGFKPITSRPNAEGYFTVRIKNACYMPQTFYLHRLVAVTFVKNPNSYDTVDHIDGDKSNNEIHNLRWVSRATNISLGHEDKRIKQMYPKHPVRLEKGNRTLIFETMTKAALFLGSSVHAVQASAHGHYNVKGWKVKSLVQKVINGNLFNDNDF